MTSKRIQRKRTKGYRLPPDAVYVGRPSLWGNPWRPSDFIGWPGVESSDRRAAAVRMYREELAHWGLMSDYGWFVSDARWDAERRRQDESGARNMGEYARHVLRGRDLVCWCDLCPVHVDGLPLGVECSDCPPCHGSVLLTAANR